MNMNKGLRKELTLADYFEVLLRNKWFIIFSVFAFCAPTWYFVESVPDTYIASSQLVMDDRKETFLPIGDAGGKKNLSFYRTILQSQAFAHKVAEPLKSRFAEAGIKDPASFVRQQLSLTEGNSASFLSLRAASPDAQLSHAMAVTGTDSLIVFCRRVENEEADKTVEAIQEQIETCVRKRDEIENQRRILTDVSKLGTKGDVEGLKALEQSYQQELVKVELEKANLEAKKIFFNILDKEINRPANSANESRLSELRQRLRTLGAEKDKKLRLGVPVTPDSKLSRDIQEAEEEIVKLGKSNVVTDINMLNQWQVARKEIQAGEGDMQLKQARLEAFKSAIVGYRKNHPDLGKHELEIQQLDNLLERYTQAHRRLTERLEDAVIIMQSKSGGLKLVDAPMVPTQPIAKRNYIFYILAVVIGAGVGVSLGLLREFMDDSVKSPDDVEKEMALSLLGTIPHIIPKKSDFEIKRTVSSGKKHGLRNRYPELIMRAEGQESIIAEAYRSLRTNIVFASPDKPIQSMLITSSGPSEGKSLTMCNTALSFSHQGEPTLIVDTDLRRPVCHHLFKMDRGPGFGEFFSGECSLQEVIRQVPGTNLKIITAGAHTPSPAELLSSRKMDMLLADLRKTFRYIFFDTPPVIAVTDACILATKVDGVVLIARAGVTRLAATERALQSLRNVKARVLGCILNDIDLNKTRGSYGYYKNYYHYYLAKKD